MKFILSGIQMPIAQHAKIPFVGKDDPAEDLLPEPDENAVRLAVSKLRTKDCAMICATCSQPWHPLSGCSCRMRVGSMAEGSSPALSRAFRPNYSTLRL